MSLNINYVVSITKNYRQPQKKIHICLVWTRNYSKISMMKLLKKPSKLLILFL